MQDWKDPEKANRWDGAHLQGNPTRAAHLAQLDDLLSLVEPGWILDVGCGGGIIAEQVLRRLPEASVCGLDSSPPMLELAGKRLAPYGDRARLIECDLNEMRDVDAPAGSSAAIASQSIHHLEAPCQEEVLRWIHGRLRRGGWLFMIERVRVPGPSLYDAYRLAKVRFGHHRSGEDWDAYVADLGAQGDRPLVLTDLLGRLGTAGFSAGCLDLEVDRALVVARAR
ncbi:MAG TPA: methyltransferase domain-containing protein [Candidatus Dormibacteraeota bacterium]|jgi:trans-aconitate methyltransferase|nr:methyltransferase domain-containing protein [Candidatus Dormibacteraeota bacterium]